jgi:hypothetical protein
MMLHHFHSIQYLSEYISSAPFDYKESNMPIRLLHLLKALARLR